jgi:starch phosphorylase
VERKAPEEFNFQEFNEGDYTEAVRAKVSAENLSQVLYPNDTLYMGKELRLKQQYFFVACSLADIVRRFKRQNLSWSHFPEFAAIQLNDTHPSLSIPEMMRILIDLEGLGWDEAWDITLNVMGYTNHTLMPEALEKWPLPMIQSILPRHMQIIFEINHRFLQQAVSFFPLQPQMLSKVSIVEETNPKQCEDGQPIDHRQPFDQRRRGAPFGAAQDDDVPRVQPDLPRPVQQQDQWHHPAQMAA